MASKMNRGAVVGIGVAAAVLVTLGLTYLLILRPKLALRRSLEADLNDVQKTLKELSADFSGLDKPQAELALLNQEIAAYTDAVNALGKIGAARLPADLLPDELINGDDLDLTMLRLQEDIDDTIEEVEERVEDRFRKARVTMDRDVNFGYSTDLHDRKKAVELAIERKGTIVVFEEVCNLLLQAEPFALRTAQYKDAVHSDDVYTFQYELTLEMSTQSLIKLFYLMREGDSYYYLKELELEPKNKRRTDTYFTGDPDMDNQKVTLLLAAPRTFSFVARDLEAEASAAVEEERQRDETLATNPWMKMIKSKDRGETEMFEQGKKWWQFWK